MTTAEVSNSGTASGSAGTVSGSSTKLFRVDGFRNPTLPADRRRVLEAGEAEPLDMSVAGVLTAAQTRTGLEDFGARDFENRLSRLLEEVEADPNLWKEAKKQFVEHCVKAAANRLKNRDGWRMCPNGGTTIWARIRPLTTNMAARC